ncbi:hypothetical protein [Actinomadura macra]|uniref:hypothetical protein n=1 Tax=Actinomadura macra TaxID=46164 RepID=UPI000B014226|nr:hypothetical protein [Actinomadura macra]
MSEIRYSVRRNRRGRCVHTLDGEVGWGVGFGEASTDVAARVVTVRGIGLDGAA